MFLRWTPEPSDWHLLQQILVSFLCGEPTWRFFWSVRLELFGNSLTICPSHYSTGHVCYLVRPPGLRNSHNAPFHPVTSYSGNKIKTLSVSFFPLSDSAVKSSCLFHPLFTFIRCVPAAAAQDCDTCHTLFTMTVPTEVVPENIWHESDVEKAWVDVHTLINISDRSHTDRRLSFLLSCAVVAGSLPQIFTSGECHTHPSPGVCCQRWRCLAAHLLTQHRAAKFSSLSGHTCG